MDIYHVIRRPLVTEKGTHQTTQSYPASRTRGPRGGAFAFEVHPEANKATIRRAIELIYKVKVASVRTSNRQGKRRRIRFKVGKTRDWKKAVVVLKPEYHIDLF